MGLFHDNNGAKRGSTVIPALDESTLTALISLVAGVVKRSVKDEDFLPSLRGDYTLCLGEFNHRVVLDLCVLM